MVFGLVACGGDKGGDVVGDPVAGEEIFATNCAVCHADDGSGGTGPSLVGEDDEAEAASPISDAQIADSTIPAEDRKRRLEDLDKATKDLLDAIDNIEPDEDPEG